MPVIEAHLLQGYDSAEKTRLCAALTDAVLHVVPASPEVITVLLHELPEHSYMRGRMHRSGAPARRDPAGLVAGFLAAMEARDLAAAQAMLAPGFTMHFPAAPPMHDLQELIAWAAPRYRFVRKSYTGFDTAIAGGAPVVYARGTLAGAWPDGSEFSGIRFIDRFEIDGDLIARQEVWNDIAETLRSEARP